MKMSYINFIMNVNRAVPPQGKIAYYRSDGTGRDTYIRNINGGLLSKDRIHSLQTFKQPKQRSFAFGKTQYNRHPSNYKNSKNNNFPHYISDGSGRDFYVTSNEGGNSNLFRWRDLTDFKFKSTLRNHNPFPNSNPQKEDTFMKSQMKTTFREQQFRRTVGPMQRQLNLRLSEPKKALVPPPVHTYYGQGFNTTRGTRMCEQADRRRSNFSYTEHCIHKH